MKNTLSRKVTLSLIEFLIVSEKNDLSDIKGFIVNDTDSSEVFFLTDLIENKSIQDSPIENPNGFLYTYLSNKTNLFNEGYTHIILPEWGTTYSCVKEPSVETHYVSLQMNTILSHSEVEAIRKSLGEEAVNQYVEEKVFPKNFQYCKDEKINIALAKNLISLDNKYYKKYKKQIHELIIKHQHSHFDSKFIGFDLRKIYAGHQALIRKEYLEILDTKQQNNYIFLF